MKMFGNLGFSERIRWRIRGLWCLFVGMLIYMVVVGELNLGNSRMMTPLAEAVSRIIFFGGMLLVLWKIHRYRKLLINRRELKEQMVMEKDERNRYLHEKSGGMVWDILFFFQLFLTLTASLVDMTAFAFTMCTLGAMMLLKVLMFLFADYAAQGEE